MYICMHVHMYACTYVCMYICMHVHMYACIYVFMYVCMHVHMYACTYVCMYICMYVYKWKGALYGETFFIHHKTYLVLSLFVILQKGT
jgi:hypothetical protein